MSLFSFVDVLFVVAVEGGRGGGSLTYIDVNVLQSIPFVHVCKFLLKINKHHGNTVIGTQVGYPWCFSFVFRVEAGWTTQQVFTICSSVCEWVSFCGKIRWSKRSMLQCDVRYQRTIKWTIIRCTTGAKQSQQNTVEHVEQKVFYIACHTQGTFSIFGPETVLSFSCLRWLPPVDRAHLILLLKGGKYFSQLRPLVLLWHIRPTFVQNWTQSQNWPANKLFSQFSQKRFQ